MSLKETINGTTLGDRVLFILLLCASLLGILFIKEALPRGTDVIVEVEGKIAYKYPIDSDRTIRVRGDHGELSVEIKDRRVRVVDASCPNKLCERRGWITSGAIICLPGRISIVVGNPDKSKDENIDATTG